jgi:hypothetical protein
MNPTFLIVVSCSLAVNPLSNPSCYNVYSVPSVYSVVNLPVVNLLMADQPEIQEPQAPQAEQRSRMRKILTYTGIILFVYFVLAYVLAPLAWRTYTHRHPSLEDIPRITHTKSGIPGDPLNVELIGTQAEIEAIMQKAGWYPAAKLGVKSDLRIAADTVLDRPYDEAPVSTLILFGRKEDLAFEKPVGHSPSKRNHVRLWKTDKVDPDGQPVWIGSATYDEKVGLSHTTGQITHHIAPDVDAERDALFADLDATGMLSEDSYVDDFHTIREGRNGGGDKWHTDGKLRVGVIRDSATAE